MRQLLAVLGLAAIVASASDGVAQTASQPAVPAGAGLAFSNSYQAVPQGIRLRVRALDSTPTNQRLVRTLREALARTATPSADTSNFTLNLETEVNPIGTGFPRDRRDVDAQGHYYQFNLPLGRRPTDPPSPTARQAAPTPQGSVQFILTLTLDDAAGRRYWHGQAYYTGAPDDQDQAFNTMAGVLAGQIGQTIRQRAFRLQ